MGLRTPLYELHVALGAKMVDFGGWDMPLHYGSQVEEHHQVRRDCGVFDVSHMTVVDVAGEQATAYLQHLLANDVARLGRNRQGALQRDAQRRGRGGRRPDRLPDRARLPGGGHCFHPRQGHRLDAGAGRRLQGRPAGTRRPGDARHPGPQRPRAQLRNWCPRHAPH